MSSRNYETAADFCTLVDAPNLLEYLGLPDGSSAAEARAKLKARRKYMQGMQSNPKYKREALFLIKHLSALDRVLEDPTSYLADANARAESVHLPVLEMTIKGVLAGGDLNEQQVIFLKRNATELGVSEQTFESLLKRLCSEAGVPLPNAPTPADTFNQMFPDPEDITDLYRILKVDPHATRDEIFQAYSEQQRRLAGLTPLQGGGYDQARVDKAWRVLGEDELRTQYDLSRRRTGPPARVRDDESGPMPRVHEADTAPPVRVREAGPNRLDNPIPSSALSIGSLHSRPTLPEPIPAPPRPARLEILGDPVRTITIAGSTARAEVAVRNGGEQAMPGRISTDVPWLLVQPTRLDPTAHEQTVIVRVNAADLPDRADTGVVTIQTDKGERASVVFEVVKRADLRPWLIGTGLVLVASLLATTLALGFSTINSANTHTSLTVNIDPIAADLTLNAKSYGGGSSLFIDDPPTGEATLQVLHPNFKPHTELIQISRGKELTANISLELRKPLDFKPRDGMTKASLDTAVAQRVMAPRSRAMDECVRKGLRDRPLHGAIRVHVGRSGWATGWEIDGDVAKNAVVRRCVERQAAAVIFPPLTDGDYATVRYDYSVEP